MLAFFKTVFQGCEDSSCYKILKESKWLLLWHVRGSNMPFLILVCQKLTGRRGDGNILEQWSPAFFTHWFSVRQILKSRPSLGDTGKVACVVSLVGPGSKIWAVLQRTIDRQSNAWKSRLEKSRVLEWGCVAWWGANISCEAKQVRS